tara:strand:- start:63 stop:233 length:171 start_codon:yes stop_codon:yes gene_type:complete
MAIKHKIKIKKPVPMTREEEYANADVSLPEDRIRFEEHSDEEYQKHCKKFFKGDDK